MGYPGKFHPLAYCGRSSIHTSGSITDSFAGVGPFKLVPKHQVVGLVMSWMSWMTGVGSFLSDSRSQLA